MKNKNCIAKVSVIVSAMLMMGSVNAQDTSIPKFNQDFKVSANIVPGCYITAENINFGTLITPITTQSASSDMRVLCSKNAPYSISVIYSNVGGSNIGSGEYTYELYYTWNSTNRGYKIYKNGVAISLSSYDIDCYSTRAHLTNQETIDFFGFEATGSFLAGNTDYNICTSEGQLNVDTFNATNNMSAGGFLKGVNAGEQIKYALEVPGKSSTIWSANNKYSSSGTGEEQIIKMKANITSSGNPTHRMTPDTYQDMLTAQLEF